MRPKQIRRVVLVAVPVLTDGERESIKRAQPATPPAADGSHLASEWQRTAEAYGPGAPLELVREAFVERLRNGVHSSWLAHAAMQYPVRERLSLIPQPVVLMRPRDDLWEATLRARELLPKARCIDLEAGQGLFEAAPERVVDGIREFLHG
jgi:hypothetical protein